MQDDFSLLSVHGRICGVGRPILRNVRVGLCELMNRDAETANDQSGDAKALGFLCCVMEHVFQCSYVGLVGHKVS